MRFRVPENLSVPNFRSDLEFPDASLGTSVGKIVATDGLGGYEPETLAAAAAIVDLEEVRRFADVGANIGIYSLILKAIFGDKLLVDAFEPLPSLSAIAASIADANLLALTFDSRALSSKDGTATFYVSAKSDSSNSLNAEFRKAKATIEVQLATLDGIYLETKEKPMLLKIDTESTEPDVLRGGAELIALARPWIICEVLHGRVEEELSQFFSPLGYHAYHLTGNALSGPAPLIGDPTYAHRDWLFSPTRLGERFNARYLEWLGRFAAARSEI